MKARENHEIFLQPRFPYISSPLALLGPFSWGWGCGRGVGSQGGKGAWGKQLGYCLLYFVSGFAVEPIEGGSCLLWSLLERHGGRGVLGSAISQRFETDEVDNERY